MGREEIIYCELQDALSELRSALEKAKESDSKLGGDNTYESEVLPVIQEVFPEAM